MGAFLLVRNRELITPEASASKSEAMDIFTSKRNLPISIEYNLGTYTLFLFHKRYYSPGNYVVFESGDFIASTGSLYYRGNSGTAALNQLYHDYKSGISIEDHFKGHFCIIVKITDEILLFRDYYGIYPVYHDEKNNVFSSSFHIAALMQPGLCISTDELYEYIFNGYWYSDQTLFKEISLLRPKGIFNLTTSKFTAFAPYHKAVRSKNYEGILSEVTQELLEHFSLLTKAFKGVKTGLSGGYDSRLVLAGLLSQDCQPFLYVNGIPGSTDIRCAREIAEGIGLPIEEVRFYEEYEMHDITPEQFFMNRFYLFDGLGSAGIFDNYSDIEYRLHYPFQDKALLNGAGGEIYRESWNLPLRKISIESFIKARYDTLPFNTILNKYSKQEYLSNLKLKISRNMGINTNWVSRQDIELLHPSRYKAIHFILSTQQQLYPFILPFYEPNLIEQSKEIPILFKYNGKFNKDLMRRLYPVLSSFKSAYGYTFDENIPYKIRLKEYFQTNMPLPLRPFLRKFRKSKSLPVKEYGRDLSNPGFIKNLIDTSSMKTEEFIKFKKIESDDIRSRVLTLELILNKLNVK